MSSLKARITALERYQPPASPLPRAVIMARLDGRLDAMRDRLGPVEMTAAEIAETHRLGAELRARMRATRHAV